MASGWEFDCEARSSRRVVGDRNASAVLGDDTADDGQAKAAATLFGRIVRQKEFLTLGGRNAWPVVGDDNAHDAVGAIVLSLEVDRPAAIHRLDSVVHQIDHDAANLFLIDSDLW